MTLPPPVEARIRDLLSLLDELAGLHEDLADRLTQRLKAMKTDDPSALTTGLAAEEELVQRIRGREGLRRQLMDQLGKQWGMPVAAARKMTVSQIAARLDGIEAEKLAELAARLTRATERITRWNRVHGHTARRMLAHTNFVLQAMRPVSRQPHAYTDDGRAAAMRSEAGILETVG